MATHTPSSSTTGRKWSGKLTLRELIFLSLIGAMTVAAKEAMSFLPNIEPVTLLLMVTAIVFGAKALYPCVIFVLAEGLLYGFGWYFFVYCYVWPILVLGVVLLRRAVRSYVIWTVAGALFGLLFGPLCCIEALLVNGWQMAFSYWISGIPFDLIHFAGNAVLCGILLKPLCTLLWKLTGEVTDNGTD